MDYRYNNMWSIWMCSPCSGFVSVVLFAGSPSAIRQRWSRTRWTPCGSPSPSLLEPSATATMTGQITFRWAFLLFKWTADELSPRSISLVFRHWRQEVRKTEWKWLQASPHSLWLIWLRWSEGTLKRTNKKRAPSAPGWHHLLLRPVRIMPAVGYGVPGTSTGVIKTGSVFTPPLLHIRAL